MAWILSIEAIENEVESYDGLIFLKNRKRLGRIYPCCSRANLLIKWFYQKSVPYLGHARHR